MFTRSSSSFFLTSFLKDSTFSASIPALLKNSVSRSGSLGASTSLTSVSKFTGLPASSDFP